MAEPQRSAGQISFQKRNTFFEVSHHVALHLPPSASSVDHFVSLSEQSVAFVFVATGSSFRRHFHPQMTQMDADKR
jgi:hypothetical protein